jgi:hypothetical protein
MWNAAGFTTTVDTTGVDKEHGSGKITSQSLVGLSQVPCGSTISVSSH